MNKTLLFFSLLFFTDQFVAADGHAIDIYYVEKKDLKELIDLDIQIAYEYFKPLYQNGYANFPLGMPVDKVIKEELERDKEIFPKYVTDEETHFFLARDRDYNQIVGFTVGHQYEKINMEIDLLMIAKEYRRKGIGRRLLVALLTSFPYVEICFVYPFKNLNDATLAFYESLGFVKQKMPVGKTVLWNIPYEQLYYCYQKSMK